MSEEPNVDRGPHSPSDEERLAAQRAHSPRAALMDRLSLLEGGIPGPRGRSGQLIVPSRHRTTVAAAARAGGATIG